eukprot:CAMPEP_0115853310 /NCGR_PEP_ID=MMETSP0287-20121206/13438_1 /TAXON_ID=412157 /ORGANISM="Chrysochromulina rotalis, Strain UIO044" /LENGTH=362 /DNA_ID=CAMNT_0003307383 /DNA_START=84 /DNA_END=1172 /DNA_ORIENTATION=+
MIMMRRTALAASCGRQMSTKVHAWAALEPKTPLVPYTFELPGEKPPPGFVDVAIRYCGICGSDVHQIEDAWGVASFPLVAGHEIVGDIVAVGDGEQKFAIGDRAAIGVQRSACGSCGQCHEGFENVCPSITKTYAGPGKDKGGFASTIRYPSSWVFSTPSGLDAKYVGPLMCAGITTYSPLKRHAKRGDRVGVVGIGGLGHLALQFGAAMGMEMIAFDASASKEADASRFGATRFVEATSDTAQMAELKGSLDMILNTASGRVPLDPYLELLKPRSPLVCVSLPDKEAPSQLYMHSAVPTERALVGSYLGPYGDYEEMLQFALAHDVRPQIEVMAFDQINQALERVKSGEARYRVVLEMPAL